MTKTYLYIPDELDESINAIVKKQRKSKAEVLRKALDEGIKALERQNNNGAQVLLDLASEARTLLKDEKLPSDLSENHDYYLWGGKKKNPKL